MIIEETQVGVYSLLQEMRKLFFPSRRQLAASLVAHARGTGNESNKACLRRTRMSIIFLFCTLSVQFFCS